MAYDVASPAFAALAHRLLRNVVHVPPPINFIDLRDEPSPCWLWQGKTDRPKQYGFITMRKPVWTEQGVYRGKLPRNFRVHRVSLHVFRGYPLDFPDYGCHLCSIKLCCNPFHLEPGTSSDNRLYYHHVERPLQELRDLQVIRAVAGEPAAMREPGMDDEL